MAYRQNIFVGSLYVFPPICGSRSSYSATEWMISQRRASGHFEAPMLIHPERTAESKQQLNLLSVSAFHVKKHFLYLLDRTSTNGRQKEVPFLSNSRKLASHQQKSLLPLSSIFPIKEKRRGDENWLLRLIPIQFLSKSRLVGRFLLSFHHFSSR